MKREELEKAIENGKNVWLATEYGIKELKKLKLKDGLLVYYNEDYKFNHAVEENYFDDLYKSQAEAEHYLHHANVSRTEHLPFLTWEDIENYISNMKHFGLNRNDRVLARIITKDSIYYFKLCKDFDLFTFQLKQTYIGEDLCEQIRDKFPVSLGEATESNFYKAYDECVKLFREQ